MSHMKKMVLVPEHTLERLQQRQNVNTAPLTSRLNGLDHDIQDVLKNNNLSEDEKARQYTQSLQNYLSYYNQRKSQPLKVKVEPPITVKQQEDTEPKPDESNELKEKLQEAQKEVENSDGIERDLIRALPKTLKERGKILLSKIKEHPNIVKWDKNGQLIFEGKPLQGSHIADLIDDSLRKRKGVEPIGWESFTKALAKMNTPEHLVRNVQRRTALRELKSGQTGSSKGEDNVDDWFPTPLPKTPGPIKSKTHNPKKQMRQKWLTFHA